MRELRHENLVRLENLFLRPERKEIDLVYEWAEHDLADIIKSSRIKGRIDPRVVKSILWQILQGIAYLHENWVMHRDVKPANILIMGTESEEAGRVKIGKWKIIANKSQTETATTDVNCGSFMFSQLGFFSFTLFICLCICCF